MRDDGEAFVVLAQQTKDRHRFVLNSQKEKKEGRGGKEEKRTTMRQVVTAIQNKFESAVI